MRLPRFKHLQPQDLREALEVLHAHENDCGILAGGTDLLVRMKQRLFTPKYLLSLNFIDSLSYIRVEDGLLKIGAGTIIADISTANSVTKYFPGLIKAMQSIGAPTIQHFQGTIGGNLCQENRCLYYNQSAFWRSSRQPCHKAGGQICYAQEGSDRCRSTNQSDGAPILIALGATVTLKSKQGSRTIPLADLYTGKGEKTLAIEPGELLTEIGIPIPKPGAGNSYYKLAYRSAIDYPIVSAGVSVEISGSHIQKGKIVIGAIGIAPLLLARASESLEGKSVTNGDAVGKAAALAMDHASVFAVNNVNAPLEYRTRMIPVVVRRVLENSLKP